MLIPIQMARSAAASAEDASAKTLQVATPLSASQRGEAIQKILDALTRHLSGREILSKDALVRLMEDLARILKFPPLPQEGGREFVRRLVAFLESMPAPDRLLLERQLGGRSLAIRVGLLAELPAIRSTSSAPAATVTPMPAQSRDVILRNPSLQPAMPFNPAAARAPVAGEVALLQAVLRKTFGVGNEVLDPQGDDLERTGTAEAPSKGMSGKPADRNEVRVDTRKPAPADGSGIENAAALLGGEGEIEEVSALPQPITDEVAEDIDAGHGGAIEAASEESADPLPESTADAEMEQADAQNDPDPDGTYGPLPDAEEDNDRKPGLPAARGDQDSRAPRVLSDAIKTLIRDSVALPGGVTDAEAATGEQQTEAADVPSEGPGKDTGTPTRSADAAARQREVAHGSGALPSLLEDPAEEANASQRAALETRPQRPADEQTMQQVIARLVENGLPREAIPFTLFPYPPAAGDTAEAEDFPRGMPGGSGEDAPGEDEGAEADGEREEEGATTGDALSEGEVAEAPDAYDLYRMLGGLG
ncbi:hypothetical protein [Ensifer sp.]|jgi:hypothetical protein|uniref:hypothetical protein n=1 Tax=Ensifer sp. TaxID=1872086 RepID=UPI002E101D73|nr:hypothetical protein [Ensifer sp.]